jgi:Gram-negative bacterial TonB protein C-terminal
MLQGRTTSEIHVLADGTVGSVEVTAAHPFFREYVQSALKQWRFKPTGKSFVQPVSVGFWLDECDEKHFPSLGTQLQAHFPLLIEVRICLDAVVINTN